uniref:Putative licpodalin-4 1 n=1 Tax=Rhipicephalus microplus TaxID=6941 RepID=A0A6M2CQB4_RHIMP
MFSYATFFCILVTVMAEFGRRDPNKYAENERHFSLQRLSEMTNISNTIYVLMRDYNLNTSYDCLSAKKLRVYNTTLYEYNLTARFNHRTFHSYKVNITAKITGTHKEPNDAYYEEVKGEGPTDHKLMTMNSKRTCFVFAVKLKNSSRYGCMLAATEDVADARYPPWHCDLVYRRNCGPQSIILYKEDCKKAIAKR